MRTDATATDYVLRTVEERDVRFVRLWFPDVLGVPKSTAIPVSELEQALAEGVGIDGSALQSGTRLVELDAIAHPDPTTFEVLPWRPDGSVARMFCDVALPDGTPFPGDSREALRRQLRRLADRGWTLQVGPELEFFLFAERPADGAPVPLDEGSYFDLTPLDNGSEFRRQTIDHLEAIGIPVKASHHEVGASQHEMDLKHTDALAMADAIVTFRLAVKEVARELGVYATFMPKPLDDLPGSAMHLHLSLADTATGGDVFHDDDPGAMLSPVGTAFLAGVLRHAPELTAVANQWVNSYKRLVSGFEAPRDVTWTRGSNAALVRVPSGRPEKPSATRIELRSPDPACNPYLVFALLAAAGLAGIDGGFELPAEQNGSNGIVPARLPSDLGQALALLEGSALARDVLGEPLLEWFLRNRRREWDAYCSTVSDHERRTFPGMIM